MINPKHTLTTVAISIAAVLSSSAFFTSAAYASNDLTNNTRNEEQSTLERIEVVGTVNNGLMQSEIGLADSSSPDLRSQLQQLPGLSVNGNGMVSGVVQYRGLFGDRLKIKVDDITIAGAGPNAMDSPLSHVLGKRQQVILHQGVAAVSIAPETLGGAVEIRDIAPQFSSSSNYRLSSNLSANYFINNEAQMLGADVNAANNNTYFTFQGQYQDADNYESGNGTEVPSTFYERSGLKFGAGYHDNGNELDFVIGHRNTNESGTPALAMDIIFIDSLWYKLSYATDFADAFRMKAKVYGNQNEHAMNNYQLRNPPMAPMHRLNTVDSEALGFDVDFSELVQAGNSLSSEGLTFGGSYYEQSHNSRITNPNNAMFFIQNFNDAQRSIASLYAEQEFDRSSESSILWQVGGRLSRVDMQADEVGSNMVMMNPAVATLVNRFNESDRKADYTLMDLVVKAQLPLNNSLVGTFSAGHKERAPSYTEVFSWFPLGVSGGLADGRNYIGSLELDKESSLQADIGLQYQSNGTSLIANVFYHKIDDYIIGVPSDDMAANMIATMMGAQQPLQWDNRAARLFGVDAYFSQIISPALQFNASAQYVDGKLTDGIEGQELDLYRVAPLSANLALNWQHNDWDVALALNVAASQDKVSPLQNEAETAGYGVWNVNVDYSVSAMMSVSLIVENLFDKEYATHLGGINRTRGNDVAVGQKVPEAGRNIGLYLDYRF